MCINTKNQLKMVKKENVYHSNKQFCIPTIHHCSCNSYCIHMVISKDFQWKNEGMVKAFKQKSSFKTLFKGKKCFFTFLSFKIFTISCLESNSIDAQFVTMHWKPWTKCNNHIEWDPKKLLRPRKKMDIFQGPWRSLEKSNECNLIVVPCF